MKVEISSRDFGLLSTELVFPDGSTMKNLFVHRQMNPELDKTLFDFDAGEGYTIVDPLQQRRPEGQKE